MDKIVKIEDDGRATQLPSDDSQEPAVGKWYWVRGEDGEDGWLGCVTKVGSNFAELSRPTKYTSHVKVHFDEFWDICVLEPNPDLQIDREIALRKRNVQQLMGKVKEISARLSVSHSYLESDNGKSETMALALRSDSVSADAYKASLVRAKEEELPELFEEIKKENEKLSVWMKAKLIPLEAEAKSLASTIKAIDSRIFSVELYAGLSENIVQIRRGKPAEMADKVHVMQRRCYMDEECLVNYKVGGMEFKNIGEFDEWIGADENFNRILPFARCVVAFKVRRLEKERDCASLADYIRMFSMKKLDESTFLYMRNGEQLFRLDTMIEFGAELFPDMSDRPMVGKIYAKMFGGHVDHIVYENEYLGIVAEDEKNKLKNKETPESERWWYEPDQRANEYVPFDASSVHYDEIAAYIRDRATRHNRLVLVLQGLLDRSPVFSPHPPWQLWTQGGFESAFELIYDSTRALVPGKAPDFEAYRRKCNKSLKAGCITIGQEVKWEMREAEKKMNENPSITCYKHRPFGNPGPGVLARVFKFQPKTGLCTYVWNRQRAHWKPDSNDGIRCVFACSSDHVLNVDAYKPGDFKIFYNDPRTRADYLKWAPMLLEAEEYHAGNRSVKPVPPVVPVRSTMKGRIRYYNRKIMKMMIGKTVRLVRDIKMKSGRIYREDSLWKVCSGKGTTFNVESIPAQGDDVAYIDGLTRSDFEIFTETK